MKILLLLSLAIAAALSAPAEEISPAIVGGVNAIPGEFPFIVSIQWVVIGISSHVCGGSIISPIWVLSAAHCFTETPTFGTLEILAGKHNLGITEPGQVRVGINRPASIKHPGWVPGGGVGPDDLVLVRLATPLTFSATIRAIRLPQPNVISTGTGTLSGWGSMGGTAAATILQKAILSKINIDICRQALTSLGLRGDFVDDTNFCTGPLTGGLSACSGKTEINHEIRNTHCISIHRRLWRPNCPRNSSE